MFIELTDILRCPQSHDEQYLVLIPDEMADRSVRTGRLGCPVCHREYVIQDGIAVFSKAREGSAVMPELEPDALAAFLGLGGPGGYVGLVGASAELGDEMVRALPGVHVVLINPLAGSTELPMLSLLQANAIPIKSRSLRGVVLLEPFAGDTAWREEAVRVVLPGLRVVGQGMPPVTVGLEVLASAGGWWVAQRD